MPLLRGGQASHRKKNLRSLYEMHMNTSGTMRAPFRTPRIQSNIAAPLLY